VGTTIETGAIMQQYLGKNTIRVLETPITGKIKKRVNNSYFNPFF
jgi:hypothetical protein